MSNPAPARPDKGVDALIRETQRLKDPLGAVDRCAQVRAAFHHTQRDVSDLTRTVIVGARDDGATWADIAERLGVSNQRAQQLAREAVES